MIKVVTRSNAPRHEIRCTPSSFWYKKHRIPVMTSITESTGLNRFFWNNARELISPASSGVIYGIDNAPRFRERGSGDGQVVARTELVYTRMRFGWGGGVDDL
jgi:hypothetical protein